MLTRFLTHRSALIPIACLFLLHADSPFSVLHGQHSTDIRFPNRGEYSLRSLMTLGELEGAPEETFGMITDVERGPDGALYLLQPLEKRVAVFSPSGGFRKWIGNPGGGPGEFMAPTNIAISGSRLIVFDRRLRRISVFDTSGAFTSSFQLVTENPSAMAVTPDGSIVLTIPQDSFRVEVFDLRGRKTRKLVRAPSIDRQIRGPYMADPGRACGLPDGTIIYANSWIYEIVAYDRNGRVIWAKSSNGSLLGPVEPLIPGVSPKTQGGLLLGMECDSKRIVLASFSLLTSELDYDILTTQGEPVARMRFKRSEGEGRLFPGFLTAIDGDTLVAFRTKPYPQVFLTVLNHD